MDIQDSINEAYKKRKIWRLMILIFMSVGIIFGFSLIATNLSTYRGMEILDLGENIYFNITNCQINISDSTEQIKKSHFNRLYNSHGCNSEKCERRRNHY